MTEILKKLLSECMNNPEKTCQRPDDVSCEGCKHDLEERCDMCGRYAAYLIANGVIVPPVKVKQTVWVYNQTTCKIYQNTVIGIYVNGASPNRNAIKVEYINKYGESSCRKFTWAQIGKQVFLSREEAEKALAERSENDG